MSIQKRFIASLIGNAIRSGLSFLTGMLLARIWGPVDYGRYAFMLASFSAIRQILDMASSSAFFTFVSQRPRSRQFISYYWFWVAVQFFLPLAIIGLALPDNWLKSIWQGEPRGLVICAFIASFMQMVVWPNASQMAEAERETLRLQKIHSLVIILQLITVISLWQLGILAIHYVLFSMAIQFGIGAWLAFRLYRGHLSAEMPGSQSVDTPRSVASEFLTYCIPFVPYSIIGFGHDFLDRWMLQHWGGAKEQAYYAMAFQFSGAVLIGTAAILRIFWKEIAEAHHHNDSQKMHNLYFKSLKGLYFFGCVIAGMVIPWLNEIIQITVGKAYLPGFLTIFLMFLYPIHQSMGQITGTVFYATGNTGLQVILGITFMSVSLILAYFLLAPRSGWIPGLGLSSFGLGLKMVIAQLIGVNVFAYMISRKFRWKNEWSFQITGVLLTFSIGYTVSKFCTIILHNESDQFDLSTWLFQLLLFVPLYLSLLAAIIFYFPRIIGLSKTDMHNVYEQIRLLVNSRREQS